MIIVIAAYGRRGKIVNVHHLSLVPSERKGERVMDVREEERGRSGPCYETPSWGCSAEDLTNMGKACRRAKNS